MRGYAIEGVVIKRVNIGEADKLITIFSRQHGKITLKAKGIRKPTSKRAGSLDLFNWVKVSVVKGSGSLDILTEVSVINAFASWKKHLGRVSLAYQVCEAVDRLTADLQPNPESFLLFLHFLDQLDSVNKDWENDVSTFLQHLLISLGFWTGPIPKNVDIYQLIEEISGQQFRSAKILQKLSTSNVIK